LYQEKSGNPARNGAWESRNSFPLYFYCYVSNEVETHESL
jgi:hypothetical protein